MQPIYVGDPVARDLFNLVLAVWLGSEAWHWIGVVARGVRERLSVGSFGQDRLSGPALIGGIVLAVVLGGRAALLLPNFAMGFLRPEIFALGVVVALTGIALRWYAIAVLGRFFSPRVVVTADQAVIETGPYRLVRHPSYTGALLTVLGVLLCSTNWLTLACFVIALPGFAYRMRVEEAALIAGLGAPYRDYMTRTKRLIPYVL